MAVSKKTKKQYNKVFSRYEPSSSLNSSAAKLSALSKRFPQYSNSYETQLKQIYNKIKNNPDFEYMPETDSAFRRFADEYNALSNLTIAANQAQAQGLTGGYGSSYAPEVASQGVADMKENAEYAKPAFVQMAQEAYKANSDLYKQLYDTAAAERDDELESYVNSANAYQKEYEALQKKYADKRDFDYSKYKDNRDFWAKQYEIELENENKSKDFLFKKYDTWRSIAENKCADYNDKKNNKAMRSYLNKLVEEDKLTGYIADNLYRKYKYVAPVRSSSSSGRRSYSSRRSSSASDKFDPMENFVPDDKILQFVNMRNRGDDFNTALNWLDYLVDNGTLDKNEKYYYVYYYRDKFKDKLKRR